MRKEKLREGNYSLSTTYWLKQSRNLQPGNSRNPARQILHLIRQLFIHSTGSLIHRRSDQILQHLLVFVRKNFGLDPYIHDLLLSVHLHRHHSAAGRRFHGHRIHLPLQVFLQLLEAREHLLERADFPPYSPVPRFTSVILPPKRCSIDLTIGSRSNCARNSCEPDPLRDADAAVAATATASILAQTRTDRPSTLLETARTFSSDSRASSISANAMLL